MPEKSPKIRLGKLEFDEDLGAHTGSCRLGGKDVGVVVDPGDGLVELQSLIEAAEGILSGWSALHPELCRVAREEIIAARRASAEDLPTLKPADVVPFSFGVFANPDGEVWYSFGLEVPRVLGDDEYVDVSREVNGSWTTSKVRGTE